ncbi:MAG: hypothetical protein ACLTSO_04990 [Coprococcus sp.]
MADFKAFWQRFKSGENGGKGQKDRFMLLALVGLLILVAIWPVGGKSGKTSGQTEASVEKSRRHRIIMQISMRLLWKAG